jgi:endonuclease/exonuclease/phosphatase family metal-dependent hydrolase
LDHVSAVARQKGIQLVVDYAEKLNQKENLPTVILGDLNAFPEWHDLDPITKNPNYTDVTKDIPVTFHGFFVAADKIDYIFVSPDVQVLRAEVPAIVASDHRPHTAEAEI